LHVLSVFVVDHDFGKACARAIINRKT
jgi:hypothetical protein